MTNSLNLEIAAKADQILKKSGVPERYLGYSFANFKQRAGVETAFAVAKEWSELPDVKDQGFFLFGTPGIGKTHLAVAALRARAEKMLLQHQENEQQDMYFDPRTHEERNYVFANVPILLDGLRQSVKYDESAAQDTFNRCITTASVVILDDFGKERATDWASERLYVLIESRYQKMLATVVTSNRTLDELDDLGYGAAVSRLQQTGRVVYIKSTDYRPEIGPRKG